MHKTVKGKWGAFRKSQLGVNSCLHVVGVTQIPGEPYPSVLELPMKRFLAGPSPPAREVMLSKRNGNRKHL